MGRVCDSSKKEFAYPSRGDEEELRKRAWIGFGMFLMERRSLGRSRQEERFCREGTLVKG